MSETVPITVVDGDEQTTTEVERCSSIEVTEPMTVRLLDKHVWGQVLPRRRGDG